MHDVVEVNGIVGPYKTMGQTRIRKDSGVRLTLPIRFSPCNPLIIGKRLGATEVQGRAVPSSPVKSTLDSVCLGLPI